VSASGCHGVILEGVQQVHDSPQRFRFGRLELIVAQPLDQNALLSMKQLPVDAIQ
jgi:hypothetical protein